MPLLKQEVKLYADFNIYDRLGFDKAQVSAFKAVVTKIDKGELTGEKAEEKGLFPKLEGPGGILALSYELMADDGGVGQYYIEMTPNASSGFEEKIVMRSWREDNAGEISEDFELVGASENDAVVLCGHGRFRQFPRLDIAKTDLVLIAGKISEKEGSTDLDNYLNALAVMKEIVDGEIVNHIPK